MSRSIQEEVLAALHALVCVLCVMNGFTIFAWVFGIRALIDELAAIRFAIKSIKDERAANAAH